MTKLSICIPVTAGAADPAPLIATLLANPASDVEVVVAHAGTAPLTLAALAASDARITCAAFDAGISTQALWRRAVVASSGDWVTLVNPRDAIEVELERMVSYLEASSPTVDALAWNVFQIDASAEPGKAASVAIPASYHIDTFDKTAMLKSFFYWEGSLNVPKMPFGIYHAAIRRSLVETILNIPEPQSWSTLLPQYEWAAKVILCADSLAFSSRPMSAIDSATFGAVTDWQPATAFPFHAGLGLTGAIAEVQFHVLAEFGSAWVGNADFVRACMIDCMKETSRDDFRTKGNAYFAALQTFEDGYLAGHFRPEFQEARPVDQRRGLHKEALLIDRFIGGARTAPEFFEITRLMMAPIGLICGGVTR